MATMWSRAWGATRSIALYGNTKGEPPPIPVRPTFPEGLTPPPVRTTFRDGLTTEQIDRWLSSDIGLGQGKRQRYAQYYRRSPVVYRAVRLRSEAVARARAKVYRVDSNGGLEWIGEDDQVQRLLDRVMTGWTASRMWWFVEQSLCIHGEAYRWVNKGGSADPEGWEIVMMDADKVKPIVRNGVIAQFQIDRGDGTSRRLPADEFIFDRYLHPTEMYRGLSPMEPAKDAIELHMQMMRSNETYWKYGAHVANLAFFLEMGTPQAEVERFQEQFADRHVGNANRPIVSALGPGSVQNLGLSNRDMEFLGGLSLTRQQMADVYGIPDELMAGAQHPTFSNREAAIRDFYANTVAGEWSLLESELQEQFVPMLPPMYAETIIRFDRKEISELQETQTERIERQSKQTASGVLLRNEARQENGLDPIDGGDIWSTPPTGNTALADFLPEKPEPLAPVIMPPNGDAPPPEEDDDEPTRSFRARPNAKQRKLLDEFKQIEDSVRVAFSNDVEDALIELGVLARDAFERVTGLRQLLPEDDDLVERIVAAMNIAQWEAATLAGVWDKHYRSVLHLTVNGVNAQLGLSIGLNDAMEARVLAAGGTNRGLIDFSGKARQALRRTIEQGRLQGLGPIALAREIRSQVPAGQYVHAGARRRAVLIARTETKHAQRVSQLEAYRGSSEVTGVLAVDNQIGHNDDDCVARNGEVFTYQEAEEEMAAEHPQGTLDFLPNV